MTKNSIATGSSVLDPVGSSVKLGATLDLFALTGEIAFGYLHREYQGSRSARDWSRWMEH